MFYVELTNFKYLNRLYRINKVNYVDLTNLKNDFYETASFA